MGKLFIATAQNIMNLDEIFNSSEKHWSLDYLLNAFPIMKTFADTPQDSIYHAEGNVLIHTDMVVQELLALPEYQQAEYTDRLIMFYGALFHDIGKPLTTKTEDNGRITSKGHSKTGSILLREMFWENNAPFALREAVCNLISYHQVPFYLLNDKNYLFNLHSLSHKTKLSNLFSIAKADILGRVSDNIQTTLDNMSILQEIALEEQCFYQAKQIPENVRFSYFENQGKTPFEYIYPEEDTFTVQVLSGLPASGKDTWCKQHTELPIISFDDTRKQLKLKYGANEGLVVHTTIDNAKQYLRTKTPFIWNSTNLSKQNRDKTISLLRQYKAKVHIVYLEETKGTIFSRNNARDSSLTNNKIKEMVKKWEVPSSIEAHNLTLKVPY